MLNQTEETARARCVRCGQSKSPSDFYRSGLKKNGLSSHCRACSAEIGRQWRNKNAAKNRERVLRWARENPERWNEIRDRSHFKRHYGMTLEQYGLMLDEQEGRCALCGTDDAGKNPRSKKPRQRFFVDHDHKTGRVRGLLCAECNWVVAVVERKPYSAVLAVAYLKRFGSIKNPLASEKKMVAT